MNLILFSVSVIALVSGQRFYDTFTGREISPARYAELERLRLVPICARAVQDCNPHEGRRTEGSCNNLKHPVRGTVLTPYRRLLPPEFGPGYTLRTAESGKPMPLARSVRTAVLPDGRVEDKQLTQLLLFVAVFTAIEASSVHDNANYVFITRTCCVTGDTDPRCHVIIIPDDDIHLRYSDVRCMNNTKPITYQDLGCVDRSVPPERINLAPPMLELSTIYGGSDDVENRAREFNGGRLRTDIVNGREWPPGGSVLCVQNRPPRETRCHDVPNPNMNSLIGVNLLSMWLFRCHNTIARTLEKLNPCWDDERIFRETKEINIAILLQILYYEAMSTILGREFLLQKQAIYDTKGHIDDYSEELYPQLTLEYIVGIRWFHGMQDGRMKMYETNGSLVDELKTMELTFRTGLLTLNRTLEKITQSMFRQPAAAADYLIDPEVGERVVGNLQFASDVMSIDITRNRDGGLPAYYKYRKLCGLPVPDHFDDLLDYMPVEMVEALQMTYDRVQDVDLMAGMLAEKLMPGSTVPPTLACIMADQLRYWRQADRFWYENTVHPGAFTEEQLYEIRKMTQARLMCDYADEVYEIQPNPFLLAGKGNEIVDCEHIPAGPSLLPWKDETCQGNYHH